MKATVTWLLLGLVGACSTPASTQGPSAVPVVAIGTEPTRESAPAAPEAFSCRPGRVGDRAEIELSVRSETGTAQSSEERNSRATYSVRILALSQGELSRAEVTLERLEPETFTDGRQQMAWHTALAEDWVERGRPFEVERNESGKSWCLVETGRCRADDPQRGEFANALGESLTLIARPELAAQLEGKGNDGHLELELSPALRKRAGLGLVDAQTAKASQQGHRFPAVFRFPLHTPLGETPNASRGDAATKLKIDRACRLISLTTVLHTNRNDYQALHELTWNITPEW